MRQRTSKVITVFGSGKAPASGPAYRTAFEAGRVIAQAGFVLCNGGYGGTMAGAAQGAVKAGGHTIGVTCAAFGRGGPNPWIRQEVPTFDLFARLTTLIRLGDAYVVLPGGTGTLLELAAVWELLGKGLLKPRRPILLLGESWKPVLDCVGRLEPGLVGPQVLAGLDALRDALAGLGGARGATVSVPGARPAPNRVRSARIRAPRATTRGVR